MSATTSLHQRATFKIIFTSVLLNINRISMGGSPAHMARLARKEAENEAEKIREGEEDIQEKKALHSKMLNNWTRNGTNMERLVLARRRSTRWGKSRTPGQSALAAVFFLGPTWQITDRKKRDTEDCPALQVPRRVSRTRTSTKPRPVAQVCYAFIWKKGEKVNGVLGETAATASTFNRTNSGVLAVRTRQQLDS